MPEIRLDKDTKTIKIVNRPTRVSLKRKTDTIKIVDNRENITLGKKTGNIKIVYRPENIRLRHEKGVVSLKHTGKAGPRGPQGPTGISTFVRVHHGTDPNVARPEAVFVEWVGSVAPINATDEDTWIDTA